MEIKNDTQENITYLSVCNLGLHALNEIKKKYPEKKLSSGQKC